MKLLKIRTLERGWHDKDSVMLHATFQLLVDFVDKEKPDRVVDWNADARHRRAWKDIRSLYEWWTRKRPSRRSPLDAKDLKRPPMRWKKAPGSKCRQLVKYDKKKYAAYDSALKKHLRLKAKWEEEDQRFLHRLIDVRRYLWT